MTYAQDPISTLLTGKKFPELQHLLFLFFSQQESSPLFAFVSQTLRSCFALDLYLIVHGHALALHKQAAYSRRMGLRVCHDPKFHFPSSTLSTPMSYIIFVPSVWTVLSTSG